MKHIDKNGEYKGEYIMKLGIIGFGNMAEAILGGILSGGFVTKEEVTASGKDEAMLARASENMA